MFGVNQCPYQVSLDVQHSSSGPMIFATEPMTLFAQFICLRSLLGFFKMVSADANIGTTYKRTELTNRDKSNQDCVSGPHIWGHILVNKLSLELKAASRNVSDGREQTTTGANFNSLFLPLASTSMNADE